MNVTDFESELDDGEALRTEAESEDSLPPIVDAAKFVATPIEQPSELVAGIVHQGSKLCIGGASKSFKTWTLLDLCLSVASGVPWLGFETKSARVLFVNFEIQPAFFAGRVRAVAQAKEIEVPEGRLDLWNLRGHAVGAFVLLPKIEARIRDAGYGLIVLDPSYKLLGGLDENKAGDIGSLMNAFERLSTETGATTAFSAHFSKGNQSQKASLDRVSGSGVFARDPDSILTFTRHEEDDAFSVETTVRNFKTVPPFVVRWEYPLMRRDDELDPAKLKQASGRPQSFDPAKLLEAILDTNEANPISISAWAKRLNIARTTLGGYTDGFRRQGLILTIGEGSSAKQVITAKGKDLCKTKTQPAA